MYDTVKFGNTRCERIGCHKCPLALFFCDHDYKKQHVEYDSHITIDSKGRIHENKKIHYLMTLDEKYEIICEEFEQRLKIIDKFYENDNAVKEIVNIFIKLKEAIKKN